MASGAIPGPWYVEHRAGAIPKWGIYAEPRGKRQNVASFIPNQATAQLIAQAPALLAACQAALATIRVQNADSEVQGQLAAVIAEATGAPGR
jgi:hypothetical protein